MQTDTADLVPHFVSDETIVREVSSYDAEASSPLSPKDFPSLESGDAPADNLLEFTAGFLDFAEEFILPPLVPNETPFILPSALGPVYSPAPSAREESPQMKSKVRRRLSFLQPFTS